MDQRSRTCVPVVLEIKKSPQNCRFLAHAVNHGFYETIHKGVGQIWERTIFRETSGCLEQKEIETLKKLQHNHIVQMLGPYTLPGPLIWPLACCHLATYLEDVEAIRNQLEDQEESTKLAKPWPIVDRLHALLGSCHGSGVKTDSSEDNAVLEKIYSAAVARIARCYGCILSAVSYLHEQRIHDNELNPEKILLSSSGLWLTDFETNSNSLNLNMSGTDNKMWAVRNYIAPEVAASCPSGSLADIFSLGCIFFEMTAMYAGIPLRSLPVLRTTGGFLSQANIELLEKCFVHLKKTSFVRLRHLLREIKEMLHLQQEFRPTAADLLFSIHIISRLEPENPPLYSFYCAPAVAAFCDHLTEVDRLKSEITTMKNLHHSRSEWADSQLEVIQAGTREWEAEKERLVMEVIVLKNLAAARNDHEISQHKAKGISQLERKPDERRLFTFGAHKASGA